MYATNCRLAARRSSIGATDRQRRSGADLRVVKGRTNFADDLAEKITSRGRPPHSLQRLRDENVITGFTATVDPHALGLGVAALVFIDIEQHDWRTLSAELAAIPGVEYRPCVPFDSTSC